MNSYFLMKFGKTQENLTETGLTVMSDDTHYKDMLFGSRAAGVGGTYIAISDDTAGCFYNPAGTIYAYEDSISGSGNAFFSQKYNIEDIPKPSSEETGSY